MNFVVRLCNGGLIKLINVERSIVRLAMILLARNQQKAQKGAKERAGRAPLSPIYIKNQN